MHVSFEYSQITEYIYIGTNMCCVDHFKNLLDLSIKADIDLEEERTEKPEGVDTYVWLPTVDHTAPSDLHLSIGVDTLTHLVNAGVKTYLHCKNGHGRSPTLVAAYFIKEKGMNPKEAVELVKSKRPEIHLRDVQWQALENFARQSSQG